MIVDHPHRDLRRRILQGQACVAMIPGILFQVLQRSDFANLPKRLSFWMLCYPVLTPINIFVTDWQIPGCDL